MSDAAFLWCMVSFWTGWTVRHRLQKRIDRDGLRDFGCKTLERCKAIKRNRKIIGEGFTIQNTGTFLIGGVGRFRVTLEEETIP